MASYSICLLLGFWWWWCFVFVNRIFFHKLVIFIALSKLIPIKDTFCFLHALSLILLADVYSKQPKLLYYQKKALRSLLPTFLQCIIFKIHFIFSMIILWSLLMLKVLFSFLSWEELHFNQASQKELLLILMWKENAKKKKKTHHKTQKTGNVTSERQSSFDSAEVAEVLKSSLLYRSQKNIQKDEHWNTLCLQTARLLLHITGTSGEM